MKSHEEMFEAALNRPLDYHRMDPESQWDTDKSLGILDFEGCKTEEEYRRYNERFGTKFKPSKK